LWPNKADYDRISLAKPILSPLKRQQTTTLNGQKTDHIISFASSHTLQKNELQKNPFTLSLRRISMQINSNTDLPAPLEAYKLHLYTEEASRNTTNAYLSDLAHFVSW
jgi:hypothetical protein